METILLILFFLFLTVILPGMTRRSHMAAVERAFHKVQKQRDSRIVAIVHRAEPMGLLGIAQLRYIDLNDAEDVLNAIRTTPRDTALELILHTPGGLVLPALQIARAIKAHPAPTRVFVPHYAMSGGTLIALAADEIVMADHAVLGPIDPQIYGMPAASLVGVTQTKSPDAIADQTLILADIAAKAQAQLERAAQDLLAGTVSPNAAVAIAEQLSSGRWTHDYPIDAAEAAELGLNVSSDMPTSIMEIMALFPDKLSKRNVRFAQTEPRLFPRFWQRDEKLPAPAPQRQLPPPMPANTGMAPPLYGSGPNARHFSYGPWNPADLNGRRRDG